MTEEPRPAAWRSPTGEHHIDTGHDIRAGQHRMTPAVYDADTGRWRAVDYAAARLMVSDTDLLAEWTPIPPERLRDPRITRLRDLVETLLADLLAAGTPAAAAADIRDALEAVAELPEESRRKRRSAWRMGAQRRT